MIDLNRWREIKEIVQAALDLSPEERPSFIASACDGDESIQHEVEALLAVSATRADAFDELRVVPPTFRQISFKEGDEIGSYRIIRVLGQGGMGLVYLAYDTANDREVALKVLPSGTYRPSRDGDEHRILARLNHPNIAALYASGKTDEGLPYFAMEYVEGEPITSYCDTQRLGIKERLFLFAKICRAVAYAHQKAVIHRDLKPGNILVTPEGEPKLLDFGIAKLLATSEIAAELAAEVRDSRALSLPFASPEQLSNEADSTTTDVYSLGVLLCVLLTGRLPYPAGSDSELYWAIRNVEPTPPSQLVKTAPSPGELLDLPFVRTLPNLARRLRGDLDAIVQQALAKAPEERYSSVNGLSTDIGNQLAHKPVEARNGSLYYRALRLIRRHRAVASIGTFIVISLVTFIFVLLHQQHETLAERNRAEAQAKRAEQVSRFLVDLFRLPDPRLRPGNIVTARELLDKAAKEVPRTLRDQPETQVYLLNVQGEVYENLGLLDEAEKCHSQALEIARSKLGSDSLGAADALFFLGVVRGAQANYGDSERFHQKALEIRRRHLPADHPDLANSIFNLGVAAAGQHQYDRAAKLYNRALDLDREHPKPDQQAIAQILNALGANYIDLEQLSEAKRVLREALRIREAIHEEIHPEVATTLNNLAVALENDREFDEAEALQKRALAISRKLLGNNHPEVVIALANLAFLQYTKGDRPHAVETFREALNISRVAFGREHPNTLTIEVHLARSLDVGQFRESDRLLSEAYNIAMNSRVKEYSVIGNILKTQGQNLFIRKHFKEAEAHLREAVSMLSKSEGPASYPVTMTMAEVASCLAEQKRFEEAEPLLLKFFSVAIERDKEDALWRLARLYELWGKQDLAAKYKLLRAKQISGK